MSLAAARERAMEIAAGLTTIGPITVSRFFSGAALRSRGVQFAFVIKGTLYLRVDDDSRSAYEALGAAPFTYAGRTGAVTVASYYEAPGEVVDDPDELLRWAARAQHAALAARKPRPPRASPRQAGRAVPGSARRRRQGAKGTAGDR